MKLGDIFLTLSAAVTLVAAQSGAYGQCGGTGWNGATTCISGWTCTYSNPYYSQCLPASSSSSSSSKSFSSTTSSTSSTSSSSSSTTISSTSSVSERIQATAAVAKLSLTDKVNLATGIGWQKGNCVGNTPPISSINFPGLCLEDSPLGVRYADFVSAFPAFNRSLMYQRGVALGSEFRGKGVNVALGPMMNLARAPAAGRNWEGFGGDPYLSGEGAYETITGIQSTGVQACAKHYINNEQEHFRTTSSSNVDDRCASLNFAFLRAVQANVASVMCSYINNTYACENDKTLNGILKTEIGFQGYWSATHSTTSVNSGLDMTMPGDITLGSGTTYFGPTLVAAVNNGSVPESRVDDMATRILAAWYLLGQDSGYPAVNFDAWNLNTPVNAHVNVQGNHASLIRTIGASSTVLLKNTNGALPLNAPKSIGIIGNGAGSNPSGPNSFTDRGGDAGVLAMGWGSGTDNFPYLIAPLDAITNRSKVDGTTVTSSLVDANLATAAVVASGKTVALVFITADSGEGYITVEGNAGDRNDLNAWHSGDALVEAVAAVNKNTVVVVNSVGPIILEAWINNPNGNGLVDVLYGAYNPSGRLPFTIGKSINDYSAQVIYTSSAATLQIPYTEGLFIDYRHFDAAGIQPRFEYGFGLSYTTFQYSALTITGSIGAGSPPTGPGSSLDPWLHDPVFTVSFTIKNNGTVSGHETPQLYISPPASANSAPYNLKGFDNIFVPAGQLQTVSFNLSRYDLSIWNVVTQRWEIPAGTTGISVGASSRDLRLTGSITN
ncbi:beta-glucosidase [Artomyces pyxidatus]|uniref:Beta-glucosidase n=1 Tax=Artomyces pyxidatus TaxID=48021 RepID=A0ACB8THH4_9AGAM|nr:beta-glucosidase [Artomyces pyxidatus]